MIHAIGDIVTRTDIRGRKCYRIVRMATDGSGWIYAVALGDSRANVVTFCSQFMLRKVA